MAENKIVGYKKVFGFVLPDWVDEKRINMSIGYLLVSLVMFFVLILVVNPNKDKVAVNVATYQSELDNYNNLVVSKKSLDDLNNNIDPIEQRAIFQAMPVSYSPEEAVFALRNIAANSGVSITEYTLPPGVIFDDNKKQFSGSTASKSEASVKFQNFPVSVSVSGDINSILKFIDKVEKSLPVGFVSDLGIQEATKISSTAVSQANLKLQVTYYQPIMVSFNLGNLKQFDTSDMALIKDLSSYSTTSFQPSSFVSSPSADFDNLSNSSTIPNLFGL